MSGQQLAALKVQIETLRDDVRSLDRTGDLSLFTLLGRLDALEARLLSIAGALDRIGGQLDGREQVARRVPHQFRYRAQQSLRDQRRQQQTVYDLLVEVRDELAEVCRRRASKGDLEKALEDDHKLWRQLNGQIKHFKAFQAKALAYKDTLQHGERAWSNVPVAHFPVEVVLCSIGLLITLLRQRARGRT